MGLLRYICAICVWSVVPFDARGGVHDLEAEAAARIAERFAALTGTKENAIALALSLRTGGLVMLVQDDGGKDVPVTAVFELPAKTMAWEDVRICLALVEDSLLRQGVRKPNPEQLEATVLRVLETLGDRADEPVPVRAKGG